MKPMKMGQWVMTTALAAFAISACQTGPGNSGPPACDQACQLAQASSSGPMARRLAEEFAVHYADLEGISYQDLLAQHHLDYLPALDFDVTQAEHYQGFVSAFSLSGQAQQTLAELGFVVVPAPARQPSMAAPTQGAGPADVFYRVFAAELPVFVSADSILHAWHRSFDKLLEQSETQLMVPTLTTLLSDTMGTLDEGDGAGKDALFYLSVARALLEPDWNPPAAVADEVDDFLHLVRDKRLVEVEFMGALTWIDFSQFIPRGHYTRSEILQRYFMAMMWLGRTDLVLLPAEGELPRPREEAAARALASAMLTSGAEASFDRMDRFYKAYVGRTNALTPSSLLDLCAQAGLSLCEGDASDMEPIYAAQPAPEYSSRVFAGDTPPVSMRFFPQRFGYGAWVTSQTTTPRLKPAVQGGRAMAMPEDVAFALGNPRALSYYADEMEQPNRENLPAALEAARRTMDAVPPAELDPTAMNLWLEALRALSAPGLDEALPQVMRTAAWHDRKLEAALASWAELRHDTILIVEQSTGGIGCQYPAGYVEPVPALFRSLGASAAALESLYLEPGMQMPGDVPTFLVHFQQVAERLAQIAERELAGEDMTEDDLAFLNQTADLHGESYYGARVFDGWYPRLYWTWEWDQEYAFDDDPSGISEPTVADVHTDAENGLALEVSVGHPGLMLVAIDAGGEVALYGGPVGSLYTFQVDLDKRMTDEQWYARIEADDLPDRPAFAQRYWSE